MRAKLQSLATRGLARDVVEISNTAPALSITFDDVPASACQLGAQIVEQSGGRATYYAAGGLELATTDAFHTREMLKQLHDNGHEIGCHGHDHLNYPTQSDDALRHDIAQNQAYFQEAGIPKPVHFAYPFGAVNVRVKRLCSAMFDTCRGVQEGVMRDKADAALLNAFPLHASRWSAQNTTRILTKLSKSGGWVVFYTHGVSDDAGPFDTTPDILARTLREANALGLTTMTMSDALANLTSRSGTEPRSCSPIRPA